MDRSNQLRHAVLGVGGVGGLIGASLSRSGANVTFVVRRESLEQYPRRLRLQSSFGDYEADVSVAAQVPSVDVLWITVKATQLKPSLSAITDSASVGVMVPLLNGIDHLALLRSRYGQQKVVAATIAVESERVGSGQIVHRSPFARLNISSAGRALLEGTIARLQEIGFECQFVDDEPTLMWSKLVFLAAFALTSTAADKTTDAILADPEWRQLGLACIREACSVAVAEGARLDADAIIATVVTTLAKIRMRSSMQKDVEQGKTPELDAIAGPILRGARKHQIDTPAVRRLVAAVESRIGRQTGLLASIPGAHS